MPARKRRYLLAPLAERDLEDIWLYTLQTWSLDQADRYHGSIIEALEGLAQGDRRGRDASNIREGYRKYAVGRHLVFYRESDDIAVIRILHQSMDLPAHLGAENS